MLVELVRATTLCCHTPAPSVGFRPSLLRWEGRGAGDGSVVGRREVTPTSHGGENREPEQRVSCRKRRLYHAA